jgi:hypothetical protein
MDEATKKLLEAIQDTAKVLPQREASAIATACMVATVQGDAHEATIWLAQFLERGTGEPGGEVGTPVPSNLGA